jgi:hypothetical protein
MEPDSKQAEERGAFVRRVTAMSIEELQALAAILERRPDDVREERQIVLQQLNSKRREKGASSQS